MPHRAILLILFNQKTFVKRESLGLDNLKLAMWKAKIHPSEILTRGSFFSKDFEKIAKKIPALHKAMPILHYIMGLSPRYKHCYHFNLSHRLNIGFVCGYSSPFFFISLHNSRLEMLAWSDLS